MLGLRCNVAEVKGKKKQVAASEVSRDYKPDFAYFMEDYFSMMLSYLYSMKIKPGISFNLECTLQFIN